MKAPEPLISVLMPVFNSEKYVGEAIESILSQTFKNFELLIVDDGSTDNSVKVIKSYNDPRIKIFQNDGNKGLSYTRNKLIDLASGEYLAILDSDDIALPTRLEKQFIFLQNHQDYGLLGTWAVTIGPDGTQLGETYKYIEASEKIPSVLFLNNYFAQSTIMIRRSLLPQIRYRMEYPPCEDYDFWIRMADVCKTHNLTEILVKYRIHNNNISITAKSCLVQMEKKILENQFNRLNVMLSESEIDVMWRFAKRIPVSNISELKITEKIILAAIESNSHLKRYTTDIFSNYLASLWLKNIYKLGTYNFSLLTLFRKSALNKYFFFPLEKKIKYTFKCIIFNNKEHG